MDHFWSFAVFSIAFNVYGDEEAVSSLEQVRFISNHNLMDILCGIGGRKPAVRAYKNCCPIPLG
jgi:hypothetical protein